MCQNVPKFHDLDSTLDAILDATQHTITGWWYTYPSEKYEFVKWDDEIPNIWKNKIHVPNHQPDNIPTSNKPDIKHT
jgi:hypothetical protein